MPKFTQDIGGIGFTPGPTQAVQDNTVATAITALGGLAKDAYGGYVQAGLETDIENTYKDYTQSQADFATVQQQKAGVLGQLHAEATKPPEQINTKEIDRFKEELRKLDLATKSGMSPSEALTRINAKAKAAISRAPFLKQDIIKMLGESSFGSGQIVNSLETEQKALVASEKHKRDALVSDMIKRGINPDDPMAGVILADRWADDREMEQLRNIKEKSGIIGGKILTKFVGNFSSTHNSQVRGLINKYGSVSNIPNDVKQQLINELQVAKGNIEGSLNQYVINNGLEYMDNKTISDKASIMEKQLQTSIDVLVGKATADSLDNSRRGLDSQIWQDMYLKDPGLYTMTLIAQRFGNSLGALSGEAYKYKVGTHFTNSQYINDLFTTTHAINTGSTEVPNALGFSQYKKDIGDSSEAKAAHEKDMKSAMGISMTAYQKGEPDVIRAANDSLRVLSQSIYTSPMDYSTKAADEYLSFISSPTFRENASKDPNLKTTVTSIEKAVDAYTTSRFIPNLKRDLRENIVYSTGSVMLGGEYKNEPLTKFLSVNVDPSGSLVFSVKKNTPETAKRKVEIVAEDLSKKYSNTSGRIVNSYKNLMQLLGMNPTVDQIVQHPNVFGGLFIIPEPTPQESK